MGTKSRQKHPITVNLLRRMRTVLDLSIPTQAALWCLFLVAFFSFLRKSNLTTSSGRAFNPSKHFTLNDIKFSRNGAVLRIRRSKTLQHREGILLIPLRLIPSPTFPQSQPFIIISNWCQLMPTRHFSAYLKGPFFNPSHSPFSPAFSKKSSRPLAWTPRTFLRIVSDEVAPHTHISQGFMTTSSSCTGTGTQTLINFTCLCLWPHALASQML